MNRELPCSADPPTDLIPPCEFRPLIESLKAACERSPLVFLPNPGNWGAAFTAAATRSLLNRSGVVFREIRSLSPLVLARGAIFQETLMLGGGGAWNTRYPSGYKLAARASRFFRSVIVLPSAYGAPVEIRGANLWSRDRFGSLDHVPCARFCHDLGFSAGRLAGPAPAESRGEFFRNDALSLRAAANTDLSALGDQRSPLQPFIEAVARFEEIHTDRVHIAIVACLLGRRCHVYPTTTTMLADLFASSIAPHFPEAVFHGRLPGPCHQNS